MTAKSSNGNGWRSWVIGALFALVLGAGGAAWGMQSAQLDKKIGRGEYTEFKERICERLESIDKKLDKLLDADR